MLKNRILQSASVALAMLITPASAQEYLSFGAGNSSCATWLTGPLQKRLGEEYIAGLWTGLNMLNRKENHHVGSSTDSAGKIAEVEKVCVERPSNSLVNAALAAYVEMQAREDGRP